MKNIRAGMESQSTCEGFARIHAGLCIHGLLVVPLWLEVGQTQSYFLKEAGLFMKMIISRATLFEGHHQT